MQQQYKTKPRKNEILFESHGPRRLKGFAIVSFICAI